MVGPIADFVISLGLDGRVVSQGSISEALSRDSRLAKAAANDEETLQKSDESVETVPVEKLAEKPTGKLMTNEEKALGHVGWSSSMFVRYMLGLISSSLC